MSFQNAKILLTGADATAYHGQLSPRGDAFFSVSSSALKEFARCPRRWRGGVEMQDSKSKRFGSLFDMLCLTPEHFDKRYVVQPSMYPSTGMKCPKCGTVTDSRSCRNCRVPREETTVNKPWRYGSETTDAWKAEQETAGKEVVSVGETEAAEKANDRLYSDAIAKAYLDACDKQVWVVGEWLDEVSGLVVPVKCLIDLVPRADSEFARTIADLKTDANAEPLAWQRKCFGYGYHIQAAWNLALYNAAAGDDRPDFCFLIAENFEPYETGKRIMGRDFLKFGREEVARLMRQYCACLKADFWPGYDDTDEATQGWSVVHMEPWMADKQLFAPKFEIPGLSEEESDPAWMADPTPNMTVNAI